MRIVSLLPSATEMVCALGLEENLIGITHECDYPQSIANLPRLTRSTLDIRPRAEETEAAAIERGVNELSSSGKALYEIDEAHLVTLAPDLIITQMLCSVCALSGEYVENILGSFAKRPMLLSMEPRSLEGIFDNIRSLGEVTGTESLASQRIGELKMRIASVSDRVVTLDRPRTLVLEWTDPPYGAGHWTPSLVELAGGIPVGAFPEQYSQVITWDDAIAADPQVIIVVPCGLSLAAARAAVDDLDRTCPPWTQLRDGRRVVVIDGNQFANRPGPRIVDTIELFAAAIHPEDQFESYASSSMFISA